MSKILVTTLVLYLAVLFVSAHSKTTKSRANIPINNINKDTKHDVIFANSFDLERKNNSLLQVDPATGKFVESYPFGDLVFQIFGSSFDPIERQIYLNYGTEIDIISADAPFDTIATIPLGGNSPTDIQYDYVRRKLYALMQITGNDIVEINVNTGAMQTVLSFPEDFGVIAGKERCFFWFS